MFPVKRYGKSIRSSEFRGWKTRKSSSLTIYSRLDKSTESTNAQQQQLNLSVLRFTLGSSKNPLSVSRFQSVYTRLMYTYLCLKFLRVLAVLPRNTWIGRILFAEIYWLRIWFSFGIEPPSRFRLIRHYRSTARESTILFNSIHICCLPM